MDFDIRPATREDLPSLVKLENLCFQHPWKESDILYELEENPVSNLWVIDFNGQIIGFSDHWITFDSATLCQIAVDPTFRRKHFGSELLKEILDDCYAKKVTFITLEVRVSNEKARAFYIKNGFKEEVVKPHYYDNGEDAIYMIRKVEN